MRLRLLGDRVVQTREFGIDEIKLVVVRPSANTSYLETITSTGMRRLFPVTFQDVWGVEHCAGWFDPFQFASELERWPPA
jgi:hypothetical protein